MKTRTISLIIGLMSFALLGVMGMQYYFIKESYHLKTQLFDQSVQDALQSVTLKLEKNEAVSFLAQKSNPAPVISNNVTDAELSKLKSNRKKLRKMQNIKNEALAFTRKMKEDQRKADELFRFRDSIIRKNNPNAFYFTEAASPFEKDAGNPLSFQIELQQFEDDYGFLQNVVTGVYANRKAPQKINKNGIRQDSVRQYLVMDPYKGPQLLSLAKPKLLEGQNQKHKNYQSKVIKEASQAKKYLDSVEENESKSSVFENLASEFKQVNVPLANRIDPYFIDSLLKKSLLDNGVLINYNYKIASSRADSVIFYKANKNDKEAFLPVNSYQTALFPKDFIRDVGILTITFPDKNNVILKNMSAILLSSGSLLLVLIGCFAFTILTIIRQKKISEMKNDFINNMTHEFKTPVATIMIASEALKDPEITEDQNRLKKLAGIIYDENVRLGDHIERVLNVARIEKNEFKLNHEPVSVHDLIQAVADSLHLQLQKHGATLTLNLNAVFDTINGDELHFSNVIYNLLDNALKYSKEQPVINITTLNNKGQIIIRVKDEGIGMGRDQQKKIFEQFYRIPTGNLHDVKGFGLGLSYVNTIVKRLNGSISVKSEKDKGSEFEVVFPVIQKNNV